MSRVHEAQRGMGLVQSQSSHPAVTEAHVRQHEQAMNQAADSLMCRGVAQGVLAAMHAAAPLQSHSSVTPHAQGSGSLQMHVSMHSNTDNLESPTTAHLACSC